MVAFKMCWWAVVAAYYSSIVRTTHVKSSDKWLSEWSPASSLTKSVVGNTTQGTTNLPAFLEINGTEARRSAKDPPDSDRPESGDSPTPNDATESHADDGGGGAGITEENAESKQTKLEIKKVEGDLHEVTQKLGELEAMHDRVEAELEEAKRRAQEETEKAAEESAIEERKVAEGLKEVSKESEKEQSIDEKIAELTATLEKITGKMKDLQKKQIAASEKASQTTAEKSEAVCTAREQAAHFWKGILASHKARMQGKEKPDLGPCVHKEKKED